MSRVLFLPSIYSSGNVSGQTPFQAKREELFLRIKNHSEQGRTKMSRHPLLDEAAQNKAEDMAKNRYFSHTSPTGITANENIRLTGYPVPYSRKGKDNNGESIYVGSRGEKVTKPAELWYISEGHRKHVYATDNFYRQQECIGIGWADGISKDLKYSITYAVFISMLCP